MEFVQKVLTSQNSSPAQIGLGVAAAVVSLSVLSSFLVGGSKDDLLPALTEDEAKTVMEEIINSTKLVAPKLIAMGQQMQQQYKAQGQELDDETITKYILHPQFTSFLKDAQEKTLEKYNVDEDEMEDAINYYTGVGGNADLIDMRNSLRMLYKQFGGEVDEDGVDLAGGEMGGSAGPEGDWDEMKLLMVVDSLKNAVISATDEFVGNFVVEQGAPASHAQVETFQLGMMAAQEK